MTAPLGRLRLGAAGRPITQKRGSHMAGALISRGQPRPAIPAHLPDAASSIHACHRMHSYTDSTIGMVYTYEHIDIQMCDITRGYYRLISAQSLSNTNDGNDDLSTWRIKIKIWLIERRSLILVLPIRGGNIAFTVN